jgi:hypothetical protein
MHHVTINQKNQKKGRQKEGNLPPRKFSQKSASKRTRSKRIPQVPPKEQEAKLSPPPLTLIHYQ